MGVMSLSNHEFHGIQNEELFLITATNHLYKKSQQTNIELTQQVEKHTI